MFRSIHNGYEDSLLSNDYYRWKEEEKNEQSSTIASIHYKLACLLVSYFL